MNLTILYFAALRERIGLAREECVVPANVTTVAALKDWIVARGAPWSEAFSTVPRVRTAVNQSMAGPETSLPDRAEVAFFPPVTGG
ncbi:MAG TPA: molybdopterin converting factor subunit 1 [Burkholderiaceae bacterium]|nr:molybdopterin converting factor subunit 1 [Burkholderiaceae bacterium]